MPEIHQTFYPPFGVIHLDSWSDPITYHIEVNGRTVYFEWSDRFGPYFTTKTGLEARSQNPRAAIWDAVQAWFDQGKRHTDGLCIWQPVESEFERMKCNAVPLGGGHYLVVHTTNEGGQE